MIDGRTVDDWFATLRDDDLSGRGYVASVAAVGGLGLATFAIQVVHLFGQPHGLYGLFLGVLVPLSLSAVLLVLAVRIHRRHPAEVVVRIGAWCLVGAVVLLGVGVISVAYQRLHGVVMADVRYVLTSHATVGAILGSLIGSYDGRRQVRRRDLRGEHERTRRLSNRLSVLHRVFRHDIRNGVNVIVGHARRVREGRGDVVESTATIEATARELKAMSDSARRLEPLLDREGAAIGVRDVAPVLRSKAAALDADGTAEVETSIPDSAVACCSPLIEDAIDELLSNAVEHDDGPVTSVSVDAWRDDRGVTIRIADDGPGIPETELEVLERGHETDLRHSNGLGLWFVHWVVDASDGEVRFEPNDSRGSVVELRLPSPAADA